MRVVGDNVEQPVVLPIRDALKLADEMELDLIEISPKADPPVCRIADYQKFLYQQKKKAKELKANQAKVTIVFKEQGELLLLRFATDLEELAKVESMPKLDGKKMNMILAPKSKK